MYKYLSLIKPYLVRYRRYLWWGLVSIAVTNALSMVAPLVLRRAINRIEHGSDTRLLIWDAALIVLLASVAGVFRFLVRRTVIWASREIEYDLRGDLFKHILRLDGGFFDRTPTGDIITRASSDIEQVRMMVGPGVMQGTNTIVAALVAVPLMLHLDVRLALYALLPLPILAVLTNLLGGVAHRRYLAIQESFSRLSASAQESLAGIRVIKAFAAEPERARRFRDENQDYFRLNMRLIRMWGAFLPLMSLIPGSAIVVVLYVGGRSVIEGRIDLGTLVAFAVYLAMLIWPMIALGWVVSLYQRGVVSLRRLATIFATPPAVSDPIPATAVPMPPHGTLEFRHLSFAYAGDGNGGSGRQTLADISFAIAPGRRSPSPDRPAVANRPSPICSGGATPLRTGQSFSAASTPTMSPCATGGRASPWWGRNHSYSPILSGRISPSAMRICRLHVSKQWRRRRHSPRTSPIFRRTRRSSANAASPCREGRNSG